MEDAIEDEASLSGGEGFEYQARRDAQLYVVNQ